MTEFESVMRALSIHSLPAQSPSEKCPGLWNPSLCVDSFIARTPEAFSRLVFSEVTNAEENTLL